MRRDFDPSKYHQHFQQKVDGIRAGPIEDQYRTTNDICCLITLAVLVIATLVFGIIMISQGELASFSTTDNGFAIIGEGFNRFAGLVIGMIVLCVVISIIFIFLIKNFPKCMVYSMIALTILVLIALIVLGFIQELYWLAITCIIFLIVIACIIFCCRDKIRIGIELLRATGEFLTEKPLVYTTPLYGFFFGVIFFIFWIVSIVSVSNTLQKKNARNQSTGKETFFIIYFVFMIVFIQYLLFYVTTFLIATACGFWYYDVNQNFCGKGIKRVNKYHLGSLTFGAIVIAIINLLKKLANQQSSEQFGEGNACLGCCLCLIGCCLSCIEGLLNVLNHNAVIVMSVTGQSYYNSAKSALSIIFQNFPLFYVVDFISDIVTFFGVLFAAGIPTLIGFLIASYAYDDVTVQQLTGAVLIIFLINIFLADILIGMIGQALSCIFIFYCFDRKFLSLGINVTNAPQTIRNLMDYQDTPQVAGSAENFGTRR